MRRRINKKKKKLTVAIVVMVDACVRFALVVAVEVEVRCLRMGAVE